MDEIYSSIEMIKAVQEFFNKEEFIFYNNYDTDFEPARVPVYGYRNLDKENRNKESNAAEQEASEKVFVDIITEATINVKDYFDDRKFKRTKDKEGRELKNANSGRFYRHYFPSTLVYWAIPSYIKEEELKKLKGKCTEEGIGLLVVSKINGTGKPSFSVEKISEAVSLIEERVESLSTFLKEDANVELNKKNKEKLLDLIKDFTDDDLGYLVFYPEPKYCARDISARTSEKNITKELVLKMGELKNVAYRDILIDFSKGYNKSNEGDYKLAYDITVKLWERYGIEFPRLHIDYEAVLKLDPKYRDHFLHSFQVFLGGIYIIDQMYDKIDKKDFEDIDGNRIEDAWVIASTYHDFNYMVQNFDDWTTGFFKNSLHIIKDENSPAKIDLSRCYVKEDYMFKTKELAFFLGWEGICKVTLGFLYDRILESKNHGVLSALSLLKYLDKYTDKKLSEKVKSSAAKAIAIHDWEVWGYLSGLAKTEEKDDPSGVEFRELKRLETLSINEDPISFLLILADNLQEEGRKGLKYLESEATLEIIQYSDEIMKTELCFIGPEAIEWYNEKCKEFENIQAFLSADNKFTVTLTTRAYDKNKPRKSDFVF
jgi:hypothetical protein